MTAPCPQPCPVDYLWGAIFSKAKGPYSCFKDLFFSEIQAHTNRRGSTGPRILITKFRLLKCTVGEKACSRRTSVRYQLPDLSYVTNHRGGISYSSNEATEIALSAVAL
jgi:hypothetical protein